MRPVSSILIFVLLSFASSAQTVKWYISCEETHSSNSIFNVDFVLENGNGKDFVAPDFGRLTIVSGPNVSNSVQIINGRRSSKNSISYRLTAPEVGKYKIGPAQIKVGSKVYKTLSRSIKIVQAEDMSKLLGEDIALLKAEVSDTVVYPGQQVNINYRLYYKGNIRFGDIIDQDDFTGLHYRRIMPQKTPKTLTQNGEVYQSTVIASYAVFPQKSGSFVIDPVQITINIPNGRRQGRGFFSFQSYDSRVVKSDPINLLVKNLPEGPTSFSGGVGDYTFNATINSMQTTTDDAIVMNFTVKGNGDRRLMEAPSVPGLSSWEVYEATVVGEDEAIENGQLVFSKTFEYIMLPKSVGQLKVAPEFTYFSPDSTEFITANINPVYVTVTQGNRKVLGEGSKVGTELEIAGLKSATDDHRQILLGIAQPWYLGSMSLMAILCGFFYYKKQENDTYNALSGTEKRRRAATKLAKQRLQKANELMNSESVRPFFEELSMALNNYIADKYTIPHADISKQKLKEVVRTTTKNEELAEEYYNLLNSCEMALFAGQSISLQEAYDKATQIILKIEEI